LVTEVNAQVKVKVKVKGQVKSKGRPNGFVFHAAASDDAGVPAGGALPRNVGRWRATTFRKFHEIARRCSLAL
jgi:hypothetical protein